MNKATKYPIEFIKLFLALLTLGLLAGLIYYATAPKIYQAVGLVSTQLMSNTESAGSREVMTKIFGRFSSPGAYPPTLLAKCMQDDFKNGNITSVVRLESYRGSQDILQLKVTAPSVNDAIDCGNAVFGEIEKFYHEQGELIASRFNEENILFQLELKEISRELEWVSQKKDHKKYMDLHISESQLKNKIRENETRMMQVRHNSIHKLAPFFASNSPISPRMLTSICLGLLGGAFFGFLILAFRVSKRYFYDE